MTIALIVLLVLSTTRLLQLLHRRRYRIGRLRRYAGPDVDMLASMPPTLGWLWRSWRRRRGVVAVRPASSFEVFCER